VATPGRLAALLRGPPPRPRLKHCRYLVLDEADRLLAADGNCGFERDVAELLLHTTRQSPGNGVNSNNNNNTRSVGCQTIMLSAIMTASLTAIEELACGGGAGAGQQQQGGRLPLRKFIVRQDGDDNDGNNNSNKEEDLNKKKQRKTERTSTDSTDSDNDGGDDSDSDDDRITVVGPQIPNGLQQEYVFMPAKVRDAYLLATVRTLMAHGGRSTEDERKDSKRKQQQRRGGGGGRRDHKKQSATAAAAIFGPDDDNTDNTDPESFKAKSAIIFVSTCERAALVAGILEQVGVPNVALHSLLSQPRRMAALGKFQSEQVRVLVATDGTWVLEVWHVGC